MMAIAGLSLLCGGGVQMFQSADAEADGPARTSSTTRNLLVDGRFRPPKLNP